MAGYAVAAEYFVQPDPARVRTQRSAGSSRICNRTVFGPSSPAPP